MSLFQIDVEDEDALTITVPEIGRFRILQLDSERLILKRLALEEEVITHEERLTKKHFLPAISLEDDLAELCQRYLGARAISKGGDLRLRRDQPVKAFLQTSAKVFSAMLDRGRDRPEGQWDDSFISHRGEVYFALDRDTENYLAWWREERGISEEEVNAKIQKIREEILGQLY